MFLRTNSYLETIRAGEELGKRLKEPLKKSSACPLICLFGDLGSGKTTFVRGLAKGLGIENRIQSPTFTYQRIHTGERGIKLYHFDCYRISSPDMLLLHEIMESINRLDGMVVIEWASNILKFLPDFFNDAKRQDIHFSFIDNNIREINIL